jgi:hypothetical protein
MPGRKSPFLLLAALLWVGCPVAPDRQLGDRVGDRGGGGAGTGGGGESRLCVSPASPVDLGTALLGEVLVRGLSVSNCSDEELRVLALSLEDDSGTFQLGGVDPAIDGVDGLPLAPEESSGFDLYFLPPNLGRFETVLVVQLNDPDEPRSEIDVVGTAAMGVRLSMGWDTPLDPDPNDAFGTNLDLHLVRPDGSWNLPADDCFAASPNPDWDPDGTFGDPQLLVENHDGSASEVMVLATPSEQGRYGLGVHYVDSLDLGASFPRLVVEVAGAQVLDLQGPEMLLAGPGDQGHVWHAADLVVDPGGIRVEVVDSLSIGFP